MESKKSGGKSRKREGFGLMLGIRGKGGSAKMNLFHKHLMSKKAWPLENFF